MHNGQRPSRKQDPEWEFGSIFDRYRQPLRIEHMLPSLILAISTHLMIPFDGPCLAGQCHWWLAPMTLGLWAFAFGSYCFLQGFLARVAPWWIDVRYRRANRRPWNLVKKIGWPAMLLLGFYGGKMIYPSAVSAISVLLWIEWANRPSEETARAIPWILVPCFLLGHVLWQWKQARRGCMARA